MRCLTRRLYWIVRDHFNRLRWVISGRPPLHIDARLTEISVPYDHDQADE